MKALVRMVLALLVATWSVPLLAQPSSLADRNIVGVTARFRNHEVRVGAGVVIAEYRNGLLVATANGLVRDLADPDNPTVSTSLSYARTPTQENEAILLTTSEPALDVAFVLGRTSLFQREFSSWSIGCSHRMRAGQRFQRALVGELQAIPGQFIEAKPWGALARMASPGHASTIRRGDPILVEERLLGIATGQSDEVWNVTSMEAIRAAAERATLPFHLPTDLCTSPQALRRSKESLPQLLQALFKPGRMHSQVAADLAPSAADYRAIFGSRAAEARANVARRLRRADSPVPESVHDGVARFRECYDAPPGKAGEWKGIPITTNLPVYWCSATIGSQTYRAFVYVKGRWIWIPSN
jgi:hypothetical protein